MLGGSTAFALLFSILSVNTLASTGLVIQTAATPVTITLTVTDLRTGRSVPGGGKLVTQAHEWLQATGVISPPPIHGCSKCVQILMEIQTQGLAWEVDASSTGFYRVIFIQIPQISTDFTVQAVYLPTGATSASVTVSLACPLDTQFDPRTGTCLIIKQS